MYARENKSVFLNCVYYLPIKSFEAVDINLELKVKSLDIFLSIYLIICLRC